MTLYDLVIIGGGINGCGAAADAALRGLSVLLCESDDLASHTSSASSKLIHGGLRYLESYEFSLVKKARDEQQILLNMAPHLVHPLPFVLPHQANLRPLWQLRAGLFLYDNLSRTNTLPHSQFIQRSVNHNYFEPLVPELKKGFAYYDCATNDARLTTVNALQAQIHGAHILQHTPLISSNVVDNYWQLHFKPKNQPIFSVQARAVMNASGPWVESVAALLNTPLTHQLAPIKGSHLVMPKMYFGEHAYVLQHSDKRIIFVIPYQGKHLIGTTEIPYSGDLNKVCVTENELEYLCEIVNNAFQSKITPANRVDAWCGVRPLMYAKDKSTHALTRDYALSYAHSPAPSVTLYGGKITTYRKLAKEACDALKTVFPNLPNSTTHCIPLPGANSELGSFAEYQQQVYTKYPYIPQANMTRLLNTYGTLTDVILKPLRKNPEKYSVEFLQEIEHDYLHSEILSSIG